MLAFLVSAVINFTNFMDGIDGLVAGCVTVVISASAFELSTPWSVWSLVGSLLGFLYELESCKVLWVMLAHS